MPKILILTSVVGGGHVFRDIAIATELRKMISPEYEIIFVSGGNAFQMLKDEGLKVELIEGVNFPSNLGAIDFLKFYFILLRSELIQLFQIRKLIKKYSPVLIILDEYFFLTDYLKSWKIPVVFMCDFLGVPRSSIFINPLKSVLEIFFDWLLYTHLSKKADLWIYIGDPDHIPREEWRSRIYNENILHVEPITKLQYTEPPPKEIAREKLGFKKDEVVIIVTVGCSGTGEYLLKAVIDAVPNLKKSIKQIRVELISGYGITASNVELNPKQGVNIHGYVKNIEDFYVASDLIIIQCGITTATECLMIGTPMIAVPITNHWEQEHTAQYLENKFGTLIIKGKDVSPEIITDSIIKLLEAPSKNQFLFKGDGHRIAAKAISKVLISN